MKIITLGTGHGSATATNMSTITYLECGGKTYLVDCADGADAVMMQKKLAPSDLSVTDSATREFDETTIAAYAPITQPAVHVNAQL